MRRLVWWFAVGMSGLGPVSACGGGRSVDKIVGTWNATSINGDVVPGIVRFEGNPFDVRAYRFTFDREGGCSLTYSVGSNVGENRDCDFRVDVRKGTIAITLGNTLDIDGTIEGDRMMVIDQVGTLYVLHKE
jgi:hypothetical protein